ncbi:hypothetical protein [Bartonella elizabethae]|uniref:hypothetical protein n=1 Tax=Bartonella elizabethae TaxID=807 RepID=UPI001AECB96C|nr:hypothetical protein [Bartonella elizabethae]
MLVWEVEPLPRGGGARRVRDKRRGSGLRVLFEGLARCLILLTRLHCGLFACVGSGAFAGGWWGKVCA